MKKLIIATSLLFATPVAAQEVYVQTDSTHATEMVVDLSDQQLSVYDDAGELILSSPVSTGTVGRETPTGEFRVLYKRTYHWSKKYKAPMPYAQFITDYGIALHAGHLPGYAASHGCIRLPASVAKKLFSITTVGTKVTIQE